MLQISIIYFFLYHLTNSINALLCHTLSTRNPIRSERRCLSGACVATWARCDGIAQCADSSDEAGCAHAGCATLGAAALPCAGGAGCYLPHWRCDGTPDCPDADDEADCHREYCPSPRLTLNNM